MFYREVNFKDTEIGRIPKDWEVSKLEKICEKIKAGGTPLTTKKEFWGGNIPFVKIEDMTSSGKYLMKTSSSITKAGLENSNAWLVPEKSLLLAMYGSLGEVSINTINVATNQAILGIIPKEKDDVEFLYYWFLYFKPCWRKFAKPTTQANLTAEIVRNSTIPLPAPQERRKIAEILSTIDKAIQKTNEIIAKTERLKKGLMQELLTKGIGHKEFKDTEIGRIPKDWEVVKLGDVLELCQYGLSISLKEKGKYPIVRMDEIVNGYITPNIAKYVDLDEETFEKFKLEKGDILFNRTNAPDLVGRTGIFLLEGDYVFASYLIRLRVKHEIFDPHFLTFYLIFSEERLKQLATRAVHQANINATNLKKLKIPRPAIEEQRKIVKILSTVDKKLEVERNEKTKLERIKQGLMDLLLTGKIRVKVS
jgi:type I restriction enzyme S subunit